LGLELTKTVFALDSTTIDLRRVHFKDPESGKTFVFLTNQMTLPAASICAL